MNKILITAAAVVAGAALITYLVKRSKATSQSPGIVPAKRSHHLTDVFAHAKKIR